MQIHATSRDNRDTLPAVFSQLGTGESHSSFRTDRQVWFLADSRSKFVFSFETFIGMELSLVPQVEAVFVQCDRENGREYTVASIINERDPSIRSQIYARERAIMDEAPTIDFSFRVISRMNRDLSQLVDTVGRLVFQRRR